MASPARQALFLLLALGLSSGLALPAAHAKETRFPAKGFPAFLFVLPSDWSARAEGANTLVLTNANRQVKLVLFTGESSEPLEEVASATLHAAGAVRPQATQAAEISGCRGRIYFSTLRDSRRLKQNLEVTIVQADPKHIAMSTLILPATVSASDESTARAVRGDLKLRVNP